ncbi:MAG: flagellar basal body P-ring formation chaperone FlgA [Thermosulfidibacteraceae bacterium]|jgi:flagella basal body P-ring formation protein FlgA
MKRILILTAIFHLSFCSYLVAGDLCELARNVIKNKLAEEVKVERCISSYRDFDKLGSCALVDVISRNSGNFDFLVDCEEEKRFWLNVTYLVRRKIARAKEFIPRGDLVKGKYEVVETWISPKDLYKVADIGSIDMARARRNIAKGSLISTMDVEIPYAVKSGEIVKVIYSNGIVSIETIGIAKSSGRIGDVVKVQNLSSGIIFAGKVVERKVVEVM